MTMRLKKQTERLCGKMLMSTLRNRLREATVFQLTVKLRQKMADWTMLTDEQLCLVTYKGWPADLRLKKYRVFEL